MPMCKANGNESGNGWRWSGQLAATLLITACAALAPIATLAQPHDGHWQLDHDHEGWWIHSPQRAWRWHPQMRLQFRQTTPFTEDPRSTAALRAPSETEFDLNRARFKLEVQLGLPWLSLYSETEMQGSRQLDLRITAQSSDHLGLRVGQWKPEYNRERRDSSGEQQFVERSIVTRPFTLDRQQGAMVFGRIGKGTRADFSLWAGIFGGEGRGHFNDGGRGLGMARVQWNPNGRVLAFGQGDLERRQQATGSVAMAFADNRSRYTRFSSEGAGELDGYAIGQVDQYALRQWMFETAFRWRGFSWQQEYHHKQVQDRINGEAHSLHGAYAQAGYFPAQRWPHFPEPLELALRVAHVDGNVPQQNEQSELTAVGNWYFNGHRNKLTLDTSLLEVRDDEGRARDMRVRMQWDVSF